MDTTFDTDTNTASDGDYVSTETLESESPKDSFEVGYQGEPKEVDQDFTYTTHTDPNRQLPRTNLYLDDVEREKAEIQRAKIEGREPDLDNPGSYQGTLLMPTHVVRAGLPGDFVVEPDVSLPVVIGRPSNTDSVTEDEPDEFDEDESDDDEDELV